MMNIKSIKVKPEMRNTTHATYLGSHISLQYSTPFSLILGLIVANKVCNRTV